MNVRLAGMAAKKKAKQTKKKTRANKVRTRKPIRKTSGKKTSRAKTSSKRSSAPTRRRIARVRPETKSLSADADSQGLSTREDVDSESVSELVDEGNIFEAGVVEGVEEADDRDEREVRTREVPEDDVPEEYLDKD